MPASHYPAVIDRSESGFGVSFPDLPGLIAAGATIQEAAVNAELALALHLRGMVDDKDEIPPPSDLDSIEAVEGADDVALILVRAETPGTFSRIQITLENALISAIDAVASNRSGFLANAAWAAIREANSPALRLKKQRVKYVSKDGSPRVGYLTLAGGDLAHFGGEQVAVGFEMAGEGATLWNVTMGELLPTISEGGIVTLHHEEHPHVVVKSERASEASRRRKRMMDV
jgi:predicted RNase H-like HicB family nuclease